MSNEIYFENGCWNVLQVTTAIVMFSKSMKKCIPTVQLTDFDSELLYYINEKMYPYSSADRL